MSTSRQVAYNTASQVLGRIIVALLSIYTLKLTTMYLGVNTYGNLVTITSFLTLFATLTDWGLTTIAGRDIAKSPENAREIIGHNLTLRFLLSIVLVPIIIGLGYLIYPESNNEVRIGILIMSSTIIFNTIQSAVSAIFVARTRNDISALIEVISKVLSLCSIFAIVSMNLHFLGYIYSLVFVATATALIAIVLASRFVTITPLYDPRKWKPLLSLSLSLGIVQAINLLYYKIDSILLSVMRTPAEVGYYGIAYRIIDIVMAIPSFFMLALLPALSTANRDRFQVLIHKAFDTLATLAVPMFVGSLLLKNQLVVAVSSNEFLPAAAPFAILMAGAGFSFVSAVYGNALVAINKQSALVRLAIIISITNILLNLILIPSFGISGSAAATTLSEFISMIYVYALFKRTTQTYTSFRILPKLAAGAAAMMAIFYLLRPLHFLMSTSLAGVSISITVLAGTYFLTLALLRGLPIDNIRYIVRPR